MRNWINNKKISTKLYVILILAVVTIYISNASLIVILNLTTKDLEQKLYDEVYFSTFYLLNADRDFYQAEQAFMSIVTDEMLGAGGVEGFKNDYEENLAQVKERVTIAKNIILSSKSEFDGTAMETFFTDFFTHLEKWEQDTRQVMAQDHSHVASQWAALRNDFEEARLIIDLIQEDIETSASDTIAKIQSNNTMITTVSSILMFVFMIVIFLLGFLLIRSMTRPIAHLVNVYHEAATGNLTVTAASLERQDEIGQLASASQMMINHLRQMVEKIQHISQTASRQSEQLTQSANQVSMGAEQVAATMEQLSAGIEEQASSSLEITTLVEGLNDQISGANEDGQTLDQVSKKVYKLSNDGKVEMVHSVELMEEITSMVSDSVERVKDLEQRSEKISELIEVIHNIASQTNLLALNAAIEAARAGETGQGFAVVAGEIRKLAEQVGESVNEITEIIGGVQANTQAMVDTLENGQRKVIDGNKQLHVSQDSFESINDGVLDMMQRIQNVTTSLGHISENAQNVNVSVNEIATISEQSAAGIEQSSATAQQQSSSMQEIAANAEVLFNLAEDLEDTVRQFKL